MVAILSKIANRFGQKQLVWLVNILMLLLLGQALASLTWRMLEQQSPLQVTERQDASIAKAQQTQTVARQIASWHLFGHARSVAASAGPTIAPETKLNLLLRGVLASADSANAEAIIAAGAKAAEKIYRIDESIPGGAILREIYADRVILEYRGRVETLTLLRKKLSSEELKIRVEEKGSR